MRVRNHYLSEPFVRLDHRGDPTHKGRIDPNAWRENFRKMRSREKWEAILRSKSIYDWCGHLMSYDVMWGLRGSRYVRFLAEVNEERLVRLGRSQGWAWEDMAYFLGVARQSLYGRWKPILDAERDAHREEDRLLAAELARREELRLRGRSR